MNGDDNKPESNKWIVVIVVGSLATNLTIGVSSLAYVLINNKEVNVALLTAFVGVVNFIAGAVAGMLMNPRAQKTESTQSVKIADQPVRTEEVKP